MRPGERTMKILFCFLLLSPLMAAEDPQIEAVKQSVKALIAPILSKNLDKSAKGKTAFSLEKCERPKVNWKEFFTFQSELQMNVKFSSGCDIEGTISPKLIRPFPASFKVRNLSDFKQMDSTNQITATFESQPIVTLDISEGTLTGPKGKVRFEGDYRVQVDPMKKDNPIQKNLGGEIRIKEIFGKKVSIKEKIYLK